MNTQAASSSSATTTPSYYSVLQIQQYHNNNNNNNSINNQEDYMDENDTSLPIPEVDGIHEGLVGETPQQEFTMAVSASTNNSNTAAIINDDDNDNNDDNDENTNGSKRKRQSFTLEEKLRNIAAFIDYHQALVQNNENERKNNSNNHDNKTNNGNGNITNNYKKRGPSSSKVTMTKSIVSWLKIKNNRDGTNISKSTFFKWYKVYGKQIESGGIQSVLGHDGDSKMPKHKKRLRPRPHQEMETILIQILRIRNKRLRSQDKPLSTQGFIKHKAEQLYIDLYGEEALVNFKCSNGWLHRFSQHYKVDLYDEEAKMNHPGLQRLANGDDDDDVEAILEDYVENNSNKVKNVVLDGNVSTVDHRYTRL